jgi:hypothetical protein
MSHIDNRHLVPAGAARRSHSLRCPPGRQGRPELEEQVAPAPGAAWFPLGLSAGIDLVVLALIVFGDGRLPSYVAAAAVHAVAVGVLVVDEGLSGARRVLAVSLALALPLSGAVVAALALGTRRRAGLAAAIVVKDEESPTLDAACFKKIAEALSPCEVLTASGSEERWATLAALTRRGDADTVRLLRWLTTASPNTAVDAALALEELAMRFDAGLESRRVELAERPSAASALEVGVFIARAMTSGLVDPVMLGARAREARQCFAMAIGLEPARTGKVTLAWARMELAAMRPEVALQLVEGALERPGAASHIDALVRLREEIRFALHGSPGRAIEDVSRARGLDTQPGFAARG